MENLHLNNVPTLNITEIVKTLSETYISFIENGVKFKEFPSICFGVRQELVSHNRLER